MATKQKPAPATAETPTDNGNKKECKIGRLHFSEKAKPIQVSIGDRAFVAAVKEFSTGSFGWNISDKMDVVVDGVAVKCQVGLNLTVVNSKEAK